MGITAGRGRRKEEDEQGGGGGGGGLEKNRSGEGKPRYSYRKDYHMSVNSIVDVAQVQDFLFTSFKYKIRYKPLILP